MEASASPSYIRISNRKIPIPRSRIGRLAIGTALIICGVVPLLPPGITAVPLGLAVLSIDFPRLRRPRRQLVVWSGRRLKTLLRPLSKTG